MHRETPFSYHCQRCSTCCHAQAIQVNPFEIACLASHLGLSTTDFIARHTENGGLFLRFAEDGSCTFLDADGCTVHPARPLVCRLYPLVRIVNEDGGESFSTLKRHPLCKARVGWRSRLQDYLDQQQAGPFLEAADLYLEKVLDMLALLERGHRSQAWLDRAASQHLAQQGKPGYQTASPWLDVDLIIGGSSAGQEPWPRFQNHLTALQQWLHKLEKEECDGT